MFRHGAAGKSARRAAVVAGLAAACLAAPSSAQADAGFRGFSYSGASAPTAEKPQSKTWFNDGVWWAAMFNRLAGRYEIYRLDRARNAWSTTSVPIDTRASSRSDALWDGSRLYVVSAGPSSSSSDAARLLRYSYDARTGVYSQDPGFPVTVTGAGAEGVVLAKDTTGRLWITYTSDRKVWVAHSNGTDATWVAPFVLPAENADNLSSDDMSAIVSYNGRIGVMWSNQSAWGTYWASRADGAAADRWTSNPVVRRAEWADDHLNLKSLDGDPAGQVFAAVKTSLNDSSDPLINLWVLGNDDVWRRQTVGTVNDNHTRAQVAVDPANRHVYVIMAAPCCSGGAIYFKRAGLDAPSFGSGPGTPLMQNATDVNINNPSTTKQPLSDASGLVAIAGDDHTHHYLHADIAGSGIDTVPPETTIDSGPSGTVTDTSATFTFSANEAGANFRCSLDGAAYTACTSPKTYEALTDGSHTFEVYAIDGAGNADSTPASRTWTVDADTATLTFQPSADAFVRRSAATTNFGAATTLETDLDSGGSSEESFFRFDVSGLSGRVLQAVLRVYVTNGSSNGPAVYATGGDWTEAGLTWSTRPARVAGPSDDRGSIPSSAYLDYTVTPLVAGNGTHSFVTVATSSDGTDVNSRESSRPPRLIVTAENAPDTILSGPAGSVSSTSATFTLSSSQPGVTYQCSLDGAPFAACSSPHTVSELAQGAHTFRARAVASGGATDSSPAERSWTVDTVAPDAPTMRVRGDTDTGFSDADAITSDRTPVLTGSAEAGSVVRVTEAGSLLGEATAGEGAWTLGTEVLDEGRHVLSAVTRDAAGNASAPVELAVVIDTSAPTAPALDAPAEGARFGGEAVRVEGTAEPGSQVSVLDGDSVAAGTTAAPDTGSFATSLSGLAHGVHDISALAEDRAGNKSAASASRRITVDTRGPQTSIDVAPADPTTSTTAEFAFSADESPATFVCRLDAGAAEPCTSPVRYEELTEGTHTFEVAATDDLGNTDATPASHTWTVDPAGLAAPILTAPADGSFLSSDTVTVAGTAEANQIIRVFDGTAEVAAAITDADGNWTVDVGNRLDGAHTFTARATDGVRTSGPSEPRTVTIDTVSPETVLESGPSGTTAATTATFAFSSDEPAATFRCSLDGAEFAPCTSPAEYSGLGDGPHTFAVRATDRAGNSDQSSAERSWSVDATAPETRIDSGPSGTVTEASASFTFSSPEAGAAFECSLDGNAYAACVSPATYSNLSNGAHSFEVRASDAAGNRDPTPASRTWTVNSGLFSDGFESGTFSAWTLVETGADGTASVQSSVVRAGNFAARLSATTASGSYAIVRRSFSSPQTNVKISGDFRVEVEGASNANVPLLRLYDPAGARLLTLFRQNQSGDRIYVGHSGNNFSTTARLPLNVWGRFEVQVMTTGTGASTVVVRMDGTEAYRTTSGSLGTSGVLTLQIGNDTRRQAFQIVADRVEAQSG